MASLQTHEQRLLRHGGKTIESAFQSKLSVVVKSKGSSSSQEHQRGEIFKRPWVCSRSRMVCRDPSRRFSADQVLRHPWIVGGGGGSNLG